MLLNQVLFGTFTPPPVVNSRRFTTMGGDIYDEPYKPSVLQKTIEMHKAKRKADEEAAYQYIRNHPDITTAGLATAKRWGHGKAGRVLDALMQAKRIKRHGQSKPTGGPKTYHFVAL